MTELPERLANDIALPLAFGQAPFSDAAGEFLPAVGTQLPDNDPFSPQDEQRLIAGASLSLRCIVCRTLGTPRFFLLPVTIF